MKPCTGTDPQGGARLDTSPCPAPPWLPGGHLQTLHAALRARQAHIAFTRERIRLPDGDFVDFDWTAPGLFADAPASGRPPTTDASLAASAARRWLDADDEPCLAGHDGNALILFHGLEGSSRSHYAQALAYYFRARGWAVVVAHFRGCSGFPNRLARAYHSGDMVDIAAMLDAAHGRAPRAAWHAVGVSLGGNALLRQLGEHPQAQPWLRACAAISVPLDLRACGEQLSSTWLGRHLYSRHFLKTMKAKMQEKAARFPASIDATRLTGVRSLREFDDIYTAPMHGFADALDYWTRAASKPVLGQLRLPCLILNARDDPFVPADSLPEPAQASAQVLLHQPARGGHAAFVTGQFPGHLQWLPRRVARFFATGE